MSRAIIVYGHGDKSLKGFRTPEALVQYLQLGIFQDENGRYRYSQMKAADIIVLTRDGLAFGHFEIDSAEPPTDADRKAYPPVKQVYRVRKSVRYGDRVRMSRVGISKYQFGKSITEEKFEEILSLAGTNEEFSATEKHTNLFTEEVSTQVTQARRNRMPTVDRLIWMKLVNADWGTVAYGDKVKGNTFDLHWPALRKANAEHPEIGDQIVLVQYGTVSHIVEVLGGVVTNKANRTHPYTRRAKVLWSSNGGVYPFSDFMGFSFHFQSGQSAAIENCNGFEHRWAKFGLGAFQKHIEKQISASVQKQTNNKDTQATSDPEILDNRVNRLLKLKVLKRPKGNFKPKSVQTTVKFAIERLPEVKAWVLRNAKGICELCKQPGPFLLPNKKRYLEVHHVKHLAEHGPDHDTNAVAVCPNCHRLLHCGVDAKKAKKNLYIQVVRLIQYK